ncbi:hypothetical protein BJV78DRAFT_1153228 [Lactifluus subvellereus]|nr:hypothetical protein BJV78DRAFT_1153228 [Lactifluus subvellereus]
MPTLALVPLLVSAASACSTLCLKALFCVQLSGDSFVKGPLGLEKYRGAKYQTTAQSISAMIQPAESIDDWGDGGPVQVEVKATDIEKQATALWVWYYSEKAKDATLVHVACALFRLPRWSARDVVKTSGYDLKTEFANLMKNASHCS